MEKNYTDEQYEQLLRYAEGTMYSDERLQFEALLETNAALKKQLRFELELNEFLDIRYKDENDIEQLIAETEQNADPDHIAKIKAHIKQTLNSESVSNALVEISTEPQQSSGSDRLEGKAKVVSINKRNLWIGAAAASVIVFLGLWIFLPDPKNADNPAVTIIDNPVDTNKRPPIDIVQKPVDSAKSPDSNPVKKVSPQKIYRQYYKVDDVPEVKPDDIAMELDSFANGNYVAILEKDMDRLPKSRGRGTTTFEHQDIIAMGRYYQGLALLEQNKLSNAIEELTWVRANAPDALLAQKATWYLALVYLKNNQIEMAKTILNELSNSAINNGYRSNAIKILESLE